MLAGTQIKLLDNWHVKNSAGCTKANFSFCLYEEGFPMFTNDYICSGNTFWHIMMFKSRIKDVNADARLICSLKAHTEVKLPLLGLAALFVASNSTL